MVGFPADKPRRCQLAYRLLNEYGVFLDGLHARLPLSIGTSGLWCWGRGRTDHRYRGLGAPVALTAGVAPCFCDRSEVQRDTSRGFGS